MLRCHLMLLCYIFTGTFFLADVSTAAIYRPVAGTDTLANNLLFDIILANSTTDDDIIDLGGQVFVYNISCDQNATPVIPTLTPPNVQDYCTTGDGLNAFPPIPASSSGGKLSIINGTIQRFLPTGLPSASNYFRFFDVLAGANFSLFNVTLEYGDINDSIAGGVGTGTGGTNSGGAIYNNGGLKLQNCALLGNTANDLGGAIYNVSGSTLDIQSSTFGNNAAMDASAGYGGGGGIFNATGAVIENLDNSTISRNTTLGYGAGINNQGGIYSIFSSTISHNFCCMPVAGGICPEPPTGSGGGIYNDGAATYLYLINSTVEGNTALAGGGIYNNSTSVSGMETHLMATPPALGVYLYNNTIARNIANEGGGGIYNNNNSYIGSAAAVISQLYSNLIVAEDIDDTILPLVPLISRILTKKRKLQRLLWLGVIIS